MKKGKTALLSSSSLFCNSAFHFLPYKNVFFLFSASAGFFHLPLSPLFCFSVVLSQSLCLLLVLPCSYPVSLPPVQCPAHEVRFDSTGVILSPGYPEHYPNLQMCSWLINVEKGYNITLHFELFQTEKEFDILEIFDGGFCWKLCFLVQMYY